MIICLLKNKVSSSLDEVRTCRGLYTAEELHLLYSSEKGESAALHAGVKAEIKLIAPIPLLFESTNYEPYT